MAVSAVLAVLLLLPAAPAGSAPPAAADPSPATVVQVDGDAANGFDVTHLDGTVDHPPTRSEALAECAGYATARARVRCRSEVRTWFRDLGVLQEALEYAHR